MAKKDVPNLKLIGGNTIPQIGLGTWKIKNGRKCKDAVNSALELGYRHFDTAQIYKNEQHVGQAIKDSGINRKDVFITTKIWNGNQREDDLEISLDESLNKLQIDYVDLLLIHFPVTRTRSQAWRLMENVLQDGMAKNIGVSNYTISHLEGLLSESKVKPVVNQVELHVFLQQPELVKYCHDKGILIEAYSPLAHGHGLDNKVLVKIANKHNKTTAQIMIRWCVEQGFVVLPKSSHEQRIAENIDVYDFALDDDDKQSIKDLDRGLRTCWDPTYVK